MRDVAALAGVSLKTVSRVINRESPVSADVRMRVERAITQLEFTPNLTASNLCRSGGKTATVGLVLEDLANPYSAAIIRAVEDAARLRGVSVVAGSIDEDGARERALIGDFVARRVDGLIVVPAARNQSYLLPERRSGLLIIFVDRPPRYLDADAVVASNRVVFSRDLDPQPGLILVVGSDGSGLHQLTPSGCPVDRVCTDGVEGHAWSHDGSRIVFTRAIFSKATPGHALGADFANVGLWIMNSDGSGAHQTTQAGINCPNACAGGAQDDQACWSPDGKRIVFLRDTYTSPEQFGIFTVALDGSDLRRVTPTTMNVNDPDWSPDGSQIVFQSPPEPVPSGEENIYTIHPDGSGLVQLTAHLSSFSGGGQGTFHPSWSPDGSHIVFSHTPGSLPDRAALFVMTADGGDVHLLGTTNSIRTRRSGGRHRNRLAMLGRGALPDSCVVEVEVLLPVRALVVGDLPLAVDPVAVLTERARETLPELQRREVRRIPAERPEAVVESHRIGTDDAARVEVVLRERSAVGVDTDQREAVGYVGIRDLGAV